MRITLKTALTASALAAATLAAQAGLVHHSGLLPGGSVPDDGSPVPFGHAVAASGITAITEVSVELHLTGTPAGDGWAGDLIDIFFMGNDFGSQTAVLLNQVGVSAGDPAGFGYDGWTVTFEDGAANGDVHLGQPAGPATILTGHWAPDGRQSPTDAARPNLLSVFNGLPADGTWTLSLSDLSPGGTMRLNGWTLDIAGVPVVPEPGETATVMLLSALGAAVLFRRSRRRRVQG